MNTTLKRIAEEAKTNKACKAQVNKFLEFIEKGDELQAWQTVLGNMYWLKNRGIVLPDNLEELAHMKTNNYKVHCNTNEFKS